MSGDARAQRAGMFVDYDNLHSVLTSQSSSDTKPSTYVLEILDEVRRYLEEGDDTPTIYGRAYGAFDTRLKADDDEVPSHLYRAGFEPNYVSSETQRNSSELQLTIDTTQFVRQRSDVQTVVLVTGNRPYLPLARWIREQGRRVLIAAVNPPQQNDAPSYVEDELYLDARNLLSTESRQDLLANAPENGQSTVQRATADASPRHYQPVTNPTARRTIEITNEHFGQYDEVYLTPLLRKLSEILGPDHDPKALVSELEAAGAVRLEKREGHPHDYTVLILHEDHPDVEDICRDTQAAVSPSQPSSTAHVPPDDSQADDDRMDHDAYVMDEALPSDASASTPDPSESTANDSTTRADAVESSFDRDATDDPSPTDESERSNSDRDASSIE